MINPAEQLRTHTAVGQLTLPCTAWSELLTLVSLEASLTWHCADSRIPAHVFKPRTPMCTFTRACTCVTRMSGKMCKTNSNAQLTAAMQKQRELPPPNWKRLWDPLRSTPPSHSLFFFAFPHSLQPTPSLGRWGEWAAILILIPLSLCGPLPERGEWSPGFWNAPPLSSGHSEEWIARDEARGKEGRLNEGEEEEGRMEEKIKSGVKNEEKTRETGKGGTDSAY